MGGSVDDIVIVIIHDIKTLFQEGNTISLKLISLAVLKYVIYLNPEVRYF